MTPAVAGLLAVAGPACPVRAAAPGGLDAYYQQRPAWTACGDGYECANVTVPLDYTKPDGKKIKLALTRLPATGKKIGSLVLNFGGPGGSGVDALKGSGAMISPSVRERFDIVSFDPRGVGGSSPVRCLDTVRQDTYLALDPTPDNRAEAKRADKWDKVFAKSCLAHSGKTLLSHVGTMDVAKDMDVLRSALGDQRLNYLGFSYGTYLGSIYADLFPKRIRTMVLDGAEDPSQPAADFYADQDRGFDVATKSFLRDCFTSKDCPFRVRTVKAAMKQLDELYRRADESPLRNDHDGRQVNEAIVRTAVNAAMYQASSWPLLRRALAKAYESGDGTKLLLLADGYNGRMPDGRYDNSLDALMAVNCVDHPEEPCPYWPVKGTRYPKKVTADGAPPIVVVGTTRDPATPYKLAKALAGQLSKGVLLTNDADGHTGYATGSACLDAKVNRYLITAVAPKPSTCTTGKA
ncbi:alpha/beta hydrolase [Nonomuraea fuscirosea]|uniref:alpha/beta hydrolase n=1 Tax=Nonomuraea fuscirosea TaxID=1291556 RepID=UPI0034170CEE